MPALTVRIGDGDKQRLQAIAAELGAVAPSGLTQGKASISTMLKQIASGKLRIEPGARK